jgi:cobalt-zinc-cadmium efflux system membrane fusion protein
MKSMSALTCALIAVFAAGTGCRPKTAAAPPSASEKAASQAVDHVPLKGVSAAVRTLEAPAPAEVKVWLPGEAAGDEAAQIVITAPVSGILTVPPAAPGRPLSVGAPLLTLRSAELAELKSRWLIAQARLKRTLAELGREQRLAAAKAGAQRELESAEADHASAQADAEAARMALQARGIVPEQADAVLVLKAPAAGSITEWKARLGQGVQKDEVLGTFQTASAALAMIELAPPAPAAWTLGARTRVRYGDERSWDAMVAGLPPTMGEGTHRLTYRLRLSGGPLPIPGTPLEVQVPLGTGVLLPTSALQQIDNVWGVFLKTGEEARFQAIQRGPDLERNTLVLGGIPVGAQVVTEGAYLLKSKLMRLKSGGDHE